jgi:hypothetical protein
MRANSEQLATVQQQVSRGEYKVNSQRVAVAILERVGVLTSVNAVKMAEDGHILLPEMNAPREA